MSTSPHGEPQPDPTRRRSWLVVSLLASAALLAVNVIAYVVYTQRTTSPTVVNPPQSAATNDVGALAGEWRQKGIEALRAGDYPAAILALDTASTLDSSQPDLRALLEVARKLAAQESATEVAEPEAPDEPEEVAVAAPKREVESRPRVERSRAPVRARTPEPKRASFGVLLVTTRPDRLLLKIDGSPKDFTPARAEVSPGRHQVELLDGDQVVLRREVMVEAGEVALVDETIAVAPSSPPPAAAAAVVAASSERAAPVRAAPKGVDDGRLDLVSLIDKSPVGGPERAAPVIEPAAAVAPKVPTGERSAFVPTTAPAKPRLVVYRPGRRSAALGPKLRAAWPGLDVQVVDRAAEVNGSNGSVDAVIAPASVISQAGLTASLEGRGGATYVLASFKPGLSKSELGGLTVAVVSELDRKQMPAYVAGILGLPSSPKLRRVPKIEDLLSTLQLGLADAVLVAESDYPTLKRRTQQTLYEQRFEARAAPLWIAFVPGSRRDLVERVIVSSANATRTELGVEGWSPR